PAIRGESNATILVTVCRQEQLPHQSARGKVPENDMAVHVIGSKQGSVRRDCQSKNCSVGLLSLQLRDDLVRPGAYQADHAILSAGGEQLPMRCVRQSLHFGSEAQGVTGLTAGRD